MKKKLVALFTCLVLFGMAGMVQAALVTIGTATYSGTDCKLIWDDDNNGNSVIWLDYTNAAANWTAQKSWGAGLGSTLTYNIDAAFTVTWEDPAWRLPATVDGPYVYGYEGDPDGDAVYTYTAGYNLANSEIGHLFYTELGNTGYRNTDGTWNYPPPAPDYFLQNTGDFENLLASWYWSVTEYAASTNPPHAWYFRMDRGFQSYTTQASSCYGLALRSGNVSAVPVPGAIWLLGSGLMGLIGLRRWGKGNRG